MLDRTRSQPRKFLRLREARLVEVLGRRGVEEPDAASPEDALAGSGPHHIGQDDPADPTDQVSGATPPLEDPVTGDPRSRRPWHLLRAPGPTPRRRRRPPSPAPGQPSPATSGAGHASAAGGAPATVGSPASARSPPRPRGPLERSPAGATGQAMTRRPRGGAPPSRVPRASAAHRERDAGGCDAPPTPADGVSPGAQVRSAQCRLPGATAQPGDQRSRPTTRRRWRRDPRGTLLGGAVLRVRAGTTPRAARPPQRPPAPPTRRARPSARSVTSAPSATVWSPLLWPRRRRPGGPGVERGRVRGAGISSMTAT